MRVVTAPEVVPEELDLFIAGGISNCPLWQDEQIEMLAGLEGIAANPRRKGQFDIKGIDAKAQITWEYNALHKTKAVTFWFPEETLCPITLLELGVFTQRKDVALFVGTHPGYQRRFDVITQLELARPDVIVRDRLEDVAQDYISHINSLT